MLSFLHLGSRFWYYVTVPKDFVACLHVHSPEIAPKWVYVEIWGTLPCQTASMQTAFSERNLQLGREMLFLPSVCKSSCRCLASPFSQRLRHSHRWLVQRDMQSFWDASRTCRDSGSPAMMPVCKIPKGAIGNKKLFEMDWWDCTLFEFKVLSWI